MAGDWIKMRGGLMQHPRLIALGRHLVRSREFREWLTPGGGGHMNGQLVSDDALRCVTCALLLRVWSASREYGKFDGDNLLLAHLDIPDIDLMAGCPGVGKAMAAVGWAQVKDGDHHGVVLPNFRQHNAPMTPAEKQSAYRTRKNAADKAPETVTEALPTEGNKTVTREEKRREEKKEEREDPPCPPLELPPELQTEAFRSAWGDWIAERKAQKRKPYTERGARSQLSELAKHGEAKAIAAIRASIRNVWAGLFPEKANDGTANRRSDRFRADTPTDPAKYTDEGIAKLRAGPGAVTGQSAAVGPPDGASPAEPSSGQAGGSGDDLAW